MAAAEEIYDATYDSDATPPVILDLVFIVVMVTVHTAYILKFTTFSLSYLEARILERKEGRHYPESMRYWRTIWEWRKKVFAEHDDQMDDWSEKEIMKQVKGKMWGQLFILRWVLRIGMVCTGLMLFILYFIFQVNLIYGIHSH